MQQGRKGSTEAMAHSGSRSLRLTQSAVKHEPHFAAVDCSLLMVLLATPGVQTPLQLLGLVASGGLVFVNLQKPHTQTNVRYLVAVEAC